MENKQISLEQGEDARCLRNGEVAFFLSNRLLRRTRQLSLREFLGPRRTLDDFARALAQIVNGDRRARRGLHSALSHLLQEIFRGDERIGELRAMFRRAVGDAKAVGRGQLKKIVHCLIVGPVRLLLLSLLLFVLEVVLRTHIRSTMEAVNIERSGTLINRTQSRTFHRQC